VQKRADLVTSEGAPLVSFHGLRHTAASVGLAHGVPLIAVSQQLGHARVDITAKVYAHLLDDSQLDAFAGAHERRVLREESEDR
jgi:integrase